MTIPRLSIISLSRMEAAPYDLLELADPSRAQIDAYLHTGTCYLARLESRVVGVMVLHPVEPGVLEIKNIAVAPSEQGKGIGKALLNHAEQVGRDAGCSQLIIGTGNSSLAQLALYQKAGFELDRIEKDFFVKHYTEPIFENGIQCKHLVVLVRQLS